MLINIKGVIVNNDDKWIYDWFEMDAVSPKDVVNEIKKANGEGLEVEINSGGGDVYAGSEIYTALKSYKGNVVVKIVGVAASAASVIAMAGKKIIMSPTSQIMIHNVWSYAAGDYRTFEHEAEVLKGHNQGIANAYMLKTGMSQKELLGLMNNETYFNAQKALEYKFVDEIMFNEQNKLVASIKSATIPQEIIEKMRNHLKNEELKKTEHKNSDTINHLKNEDLKKTESKNSDNINQIQARLNLLKLMEVTNNE
jgi:ATP-dependent Clp protease, protease subunit